MTSADRGAVTARLGSGGEGTTRFGSGSQRTTWFSLAKYPRAVLNHGSFD